MDCVQLSCQDALAVQGPRTVVVMHDNYADKCSSARSSAYQSQEGHAMQQ